MNIEEKRELANRNRPQKGASIKVEPIKSTNDIDLIRKLLEDHPRNYCLFTMGINTALRGSDILNIKVGQVRYVKQGEEIFVKEKKTKKHRSITMNKHLYDAVQKLLKTLSKAHDNDYLFVSYRTKSKITVMHLNKLVKRWCKGINMHGNYGSHTLRKTWGYMQRTKFKVDIPTLMTVYNHASQKQTLEYLCIQP